MTVINNDLGNVIIEGVADHDELLTFAGIATVLEGTILARQAVALAVAASAFTGTGDGTVTLATVVAGAIVPQVGAYVLTCTEAIADGGVFKLEDPNGAQVAGGITIDVGAGGSTVIEVEGMQFTITDGAANFVVGDFATLTVATGAGKLVPFATDGAGGAQVPKSVLTYEVTSTGAGDVPVRTMQNGKLNGNRLVIDADGDNSNITSAILDQLRDYMLVTIDVQDLSLLDNQ